MCFVVFAYVLFCKICIVLTLSIDGNWTATIILTTATRQPEGIGGGAQNYRCRWIFVGLVMSSAYNVYIYSGVCVYIYIIYNRYILWLVLAFVGLRWCSKRAASEVYHGFMVIGRNADNWYRSPLSAVARATYEWPRAYCSACIINRVSV